MPVALDLCSLVPQGSVRLSQLAMLDAGPKGLTVARRDGAGGLQAAWWGLAVLIATVLGLVGATVYSRRIASRLNDDVVNIAMNASPTIEHVSAAREQVLRIALVAAAAIERNSDTAAFDRAEFAPALSSLRREAGAYRALPFFPGERDLSAEADKAIAGLETAVSDVSAHLEQGSHAEASAAFRRVLMPAAGRADAALQAIVAFNAEKQHRLAMEIPRHVSRGDRIGYVLQGVAGVFGLVLMGLVLRATRQYARLLSTRQRLADEHARDVDAFGVKLESIIGASVTISEAIATGDEPSRVFQTIADQARVVVNAQFCAVGCGADPTRPFDVWVTSGMPAATVAKLGGPPRPAGLLGAVGRERRPIRVPEARAHAAFRGIPSGHPEVGPFLGVPILHGDDNLGNLYLARVTGQPAFSAEDQRAAELLAGYVGVAIVNARLYKTARDATRAREDLLAMVSHDLKNPLSAIRLTTETLRRQAGADPAVDAFRQRIQRSTDRMAQLIDDLLDAARIEAGALQAAAKPESVSSLLDSALEMFRGMAAGKRIDLTCALPPAPATVLCERNLVLRLLSNLIGNALKFSPEGSAISVVAVVAGDGVEFSVGDAGPGIPAEHLPHVFDRYWQQKAADRRGSGLGLYIAKGIVEAHGGRIRVDSTPGRGTTVHFTLPAAGAPQADDCVVSPTAEATQTAHPGE
jgi:signal transduction histidine kinase